MRMPGPWPIPTRPKRARICKPRSFRPQVEMLEPRRVMATLGLGIQLRADNGTATPGDVISSIQQNSSFWVQVMVEDQRSDATHPGIISLPANLSWDPAKLQLVSPIPVAGAIGPNDPILNPSLSLQRNLGQVNTAAGFVNFTKPTSGNIDPPTTANLVGLRAAALPNAPGSGSAIATTSAGSVFSLLHFTALAAADNTPFMIQVAGSMSFTDAAALDGVATVTSPTVRLQRSNNDAPDVNEEQLAVTEFIQITASTSSLSGVKFDDTNTNGVQDNNEIGLPNVAITLSGTITGGGAITPITVLTGADGTFHFDNLAPGTYRILETPPARFITTKNTVGTLISDTGTLPPGVSPGVAGTNDFSSIILAGGVDGVNYSFGEVPIPDKRMFLASTNLRRLLAAQLGVTLTPITGNGNNITVTADSSAITVAVDGGKTTVVPLASSPLVAIDAQGGNVTMTGTAADEVASMSPGSGSLRLGNDFSGSNYSVLATNAKQVVANGGGGDDTAFLYDTPANDALVATGDSATLTAADEEMVQAVAFNLVHAQSSTHAGVSDDDTRSVNSPSYLLRTPGKWRTI